MMKITFNVPKKNVIYGSMKLALDLMEKKRKISAKRFVIIEEAITLTMTLMMKITLNVPKKNVIYGT